LLLDMIATLVPDFLPPAFSYRNKYSAVNVCISRSCWGQVQYANRKCCRYYLKGRILNDCTISHDQIKNKAVERKLQCI
jgi:hypothetical protein